MDSALVPRTAFVLVLTVVGAILVGSFVAASWSHPSLLPTAGGQGEVGEVTTAYKTYTQTLDLIDRDDMFQRLTKAANGHIGAHEGKGEDFEAEWTSPPVHTEAGDTIKKVVTKHVFSFPQDYPKLKAMEDDKTEEGTNLRRILKSVQKAIKEHADECGGDKDCEGKPFRVVIQKVHRIYIHKNPQGLATKIKNEVPGRVGTIYLKVDASLADLTPQVVHRMEAGLAHQLGVDRKDVEIDPQPGSVILRVRVQDPHVDGKELLTEYKKMFVAHEEQCAGGKAASCDNLILVGIKELAAHFGAPAPPASAPWKHPTHPPHHKRAGKPIILTYPPHHSRAGTRMNKEDLKKALQRSQDAMADKIRKLRNGLKSDVGGLGSRIDDVSDKEKGLLGTANQNTAALMKKMSASERANYRKMIQHEQDVLGRLSEKEREELKDMQKHWDTMSKDQQEALMSRWTRKLHEDEIKLRSTNDHANEREDAERNREWHQMTEEERSNARDLMRRLMRRAGSKLDEEAKAVGEKAEEAAKMAAAAAAKAAEAEAAGNHKLAAHHRAQARHHSGRAAALRSEQRRIHRLQEEEQRKLSRQARHSEHEQHKEMKWAMKAMQKSMNKEQLASMKMMEHQETRMEKNFMAHMHQMYKGYKHKMAAQAAAAKKALITHPPHHEKAGQYVDPAAAAAAKAAMAQPQPCNVGAVGCGVPVAPAMPCAGIATATGCAAPLPCPGVAGPMGCQPPAAYPQAAYPQAAPLACAGQSGLSAAVCALQGKVSDIWQKAQPLLGGGHGVSQSS